MRRRTTVRAGHPARRAGAGGGGGAKDDRVLLAWARDRDGSKVHVARLSPGDRRARAPFTCVACAERLVPHLGKVRARHFAHLPGSSCALTAPESALHLDAKERLLALCRDAFAGTRRVTVLARCPGCRRGAPLELARAGDAAAGEASVGPLRVDVLVLAAGRPALAFEVKVTHAVDEAKEAALALAGVPAVEIDARDEWERDAGDAAEIVPLRSLGFERCPACVALARADAGRAEGGEAAEVAELEAYRARGLLGALAAERDLGVIARRFACPACGGRELVRGEALLRHGCPGEAPRPVAWRAYDGSAIALSWWRRRDGRTVA